MKFRLIYDGPLQPSQRDPENGQEVPLAEHKHAIRRVFHGQLQRLWETNRFLKETRKFASDFMERDRANRLTEAKGDDSKLTLLKDIVAELHEESGYRFVPLVLERWSLRCDLQVLFLRRDAPGSVIQAGDIDNRIKTLLDALRKPKGAPELKGAETPLAGEDPFFCLLEDDKLVTSFSVESDVLLDPLVLASADNRRVRLVVTVTLAPYDVTNTNLGFA